MSLIGNLFYERHKRSSTPQIGMLESYHLKIGGSIPSRGVACHLTRFFAITCPALPPKSQGLLFTTAVVQRAMPLSHTPHAGANCPIFSADIFTAAVVADGHAPTSYTIYTGALSSIQ